MKILILTMMLVGIALAGPMTPSFTVDGLALDPASPWLAQPCLALAGTECWVAWEDRPLPADFDFNDAGAHLVLGNGVATMEWWDGLASDSNLIQIGASGPLGVSLFSPGPVSWSQPMDGQPLPLTLLDQTTGDRWDWGAHSWIRQAAPIPEPAPWAMIGAGLVMIWGSLRKWS